MNADSHGFDWEWLEETDSTNRVAAERVLGRWERGERAAGLVVLARRQTAGRGQHGRVWESPAGGLYLSVVVEGVAEGSGARDRLALVAGVAVAETIDELVSGHGRVARIRWPNDVLIQEKKVAGILCEALAQGEKWAAVIGIGVNVMMRREDFSPELRELAGSLFTFDEQPRAVEDVARVVVGQLGSWLGRVQCSLGPVVQEVRRRDALQGRPVRFDSGAGVFDAVAEGIDERGWLILRRNEWELQAYERGSVIAVGR